MSGEQCGRNDLTDSSMRSVNNLTENGSLHKAKSTIVQHRAHLVCVKAPTVEPSKEKYHPKGNKRQPVLVKAEDTPQMMTPSQFLAEVKQSSEERLANTYTMHLPRKMKPLEVDTSLKKQFYVSNKEPLFQPFPSELYFQNFIPMQTYHLPIVLRNKDMHTSHFIRVTQMDSPYFQVMSPASEGDKVCPGISVTFDVYFLPNEYKDYEHQLTFITERESFVVPIHAIGARGVLDFPDSVHFSTCPVKYPTTKTLLIRNIGNQVAKFTLYVEKCEKGHDNFFVSPEFSNLAINDTMQVSIKFFPTHTGNYHDKLIIVYDTGEKLNVSLYGTAQDVNIQLNKKSLQMDGTYVSTVTNYNVTIFNYSNIIAHFRWTQFATQEEEDQQKILYQLEIWRDEQREICSYLEHTRSDCKTTGRGSVLCRNFRNKRQAVSNKSMLFEDEVVRFDPLEGELWPNTSIDVNIIFKPFEADHYSRVAFCDISGRQSRLPLHILGDGMGPKLDLSFKELDMGQIFVGSENMYELVIWNKGDIDATYFILPNFSDFGPSFDFEPADGKILARHYQAIRVTFFSTKFGRINECFQIEVVGTLKTMKVTFIGSVIAPTLHFSIPKLDFGIVSYGFPCERGFSIINTSLVPVSFQLRIPSGGNVPSIRAMGDVDPQGKSSFPLRGLPSPKEFNIVPSKGNIPPHSSTDIMVTFISNHVKIFEEVLVVDVEKVGRNFQGLPVRARCIIPEIELVTPEIYFGKCCLRYPFEKMIVLKNESSLPASYIVLPQEQPKEIPPSILFRSPQPRGIVAPNSKQEVPIEIQVQKLLEQEEVCTIAIFGSDKIRLKVWLRCSGEGPVVHFVPDHLDWGVIPVLTPVSKTLTLSNQSLIPAYFSAFFNHPSVPFTVSPEEGEIPPESSFEVTITANLKDSLHFQKSLQLHFKESDSRRVPVQAEGEGTTIVSSPLLLPILDMGPNFCKRPVRRTFTLTNKGRRHHQLTWTTEGYTWCGAWRKMAAGAKDDKKNQKKGKVKSVSEINAGPIFCVSPARFCLKAGQSTHFSVEACVKEPMSVSEVLMCHAILGRSGKKEIIMKVNVSAVFVCPILEFSTTSILFHVEKKRHEKLEILEQKLEFCNVSSLPLSVSMELHYPFSILLPDTTMTDHMELIVPDQQCHVLKLCFDPNYKTDLHIRTIDDVLTFSYKEHSHIDKVSLRGEVHFPNLEFEKMEVNFGCILNDTEVTRFVKMTNISPLQVKYRWSFFLDPTQTQVKRVIRPKAPALGTEEQLTLSSHDQELKQKEEVYDTEMLQSDVQLSYIMDFEEVHASLEISAGNTSENAEPDLWKSDLPILMEEEEEKSTDTATELAQSKDLELTGSNISKASSVGKTESAVMLDNSLQMEQNSLTALQNQLSLNGADTKALCYNPILSGLMSDVAIQQHPLKVEEVFDITPLYGTLESGQKELVTFTFFGHSNVHGEVKAVCEVEGGPKYEVMISGEASLVEFHFELNELDFGKQLYDSVGVKELTLVNSGRVPFTYYALDIQPVKLDTPKPGQPELVPFSGTMDPCSEQKLQVRYLPGIPGPFSKQFSIQVAHFEPYLVHIYGEGVFPRISLDLPRCVEEDQDYQCLVREACKNLLPSSSETALENFINVCLTKSVGHQHEGLSVSGSLKSVDTECQETSVLPTILDVQMEVERLAIRNFAVQKFESIFQCDCQCKEKEEEEEKCADTGLESLQSHQSCQASALSSGEKGKDTAQPPPKKLKPRLPKYLLDFGYVVLGTQREHIVRATNTGWFPVSFRVKRRALSHLGFVVGLDKVHQLPGAPDNETVDFKITFDPNAANLPMGPVEVTVPIDILQGPVVELCLRAHVTEPCMRLSHDSLDLQEVKVGECRISVVQIHNHHHVPGAWMAIVNSNAAANEGCAALQKRRKVKVVPKTVATFDVYPSSGVLQPGSRVNVQVNFTPLEQKLYKETIQFKVAQSTQHMRLVCQGQGLEPCLEFTPSVLEFSSILPFSNGDLATVTITNPCSFPVEMYCLELDCQYLDEEKVLRKLPGYDDLNNILLPQRNPGEKLSSHLLDYYNECKRRLEEEDDAFDLLSILSGDTDKEVDDVDKMKQAAGRSGSVPAAGRVEITKDTDEVTLVMTQDTKDPLAASEPMQEPLIPPNGVGQVEESPVMEALAAYLGVDLSAEARAASNRCGLAIIVHGTPMSGKSITAISLAQQYEAAVVTLDGVVVEAITSGTSSAATSIRELCLEAGRSWAEEQRLLEELHHKEEISESHLLQPHHGEPLKGAGGSKTKDKDKSGACSRTTVSLAPETRGCNQIPIGSGGGYNTGCRLLSISGSETEEENIVSCILPEDLLVEILVERLQMEDCQYGVVFDGLESLFVPNAFTAASCILKALNNRRFIFFCTLRLDYSAYQEQEKKNQEERETQAKLEEDLERQMVEEMEEDEYEALTQQEKERIDQIRLKLRKQRRKRAQEEKERKEREKEEERRREEEQKLKKHTKRKCDKEKKGLESSDKRESTSGLQKAQQSVSDMMGHSEHDPKKKKHGKNGKKDLRKSSLTEMSVSVTLVDTDPVKEAEALLLKRFRIFDQTFKELTDLLDLWDRTTLQLRRPHGMVDAVEEEPVKKGKGKDRGEKDRQKQAEKESSGAALGQVPSAVVEGAEGAEGEGEEEFARVPHIMVDCSDLSAPAWQKIMEKGMLPSKQEVLEGMGQGPDGPPLPPPATLSVVPYPPRRRKCHTSAHRGKFAFVEDPISVEKSTDGEDEKLDQLKRRQSVRPTTSEMSQNKGKDHKKSICKVETPETQPPNSSFFRSLDRLSLLRCVVPAYGQKQLTIFFSSEEQGQFEQTFHFELVGIKRQYQVVCKGSCSFPTISKDPRVVFHSRKRTLKEKEIVHKKYIHATETFEFGPLLVGKIRDRVSSSHNHFPDNCEMLQIHNPTGHVADVTFCFLNDLKSSIFYLNPPSLTIKPGETAPLFVSANPMTPGRFEDAIVCCIHENPEPVMFTVACDAVRPELQLDRKQVQFDRMIIHRKDTKVIFLRNPTMLPVAWRLVGLENMGDDFTVSAENGVLSPLSEIPLYTHFRAVKPVQTSKRTIRLEVMDVEDVLGVVQSEAIQFLAEAYDVSLDMNLSKGPACGVDFGTVHVNEEVKEIITLKNKGKYEIGCHFVVETDDPKQAAVFSFSPNKVSLVALEKPTQVAVECKCPYEVEIIDAPLFKCYIAEPSRSKELIATIPIRASVKAVYSKFTICPTSDISFGYLVVNTKKMRTLNIQNDGDFDFRFTICRKSDTERLNQARRMSSPHPGKTTKQANQGRHGHQTPGKKENSRQDAFGGRLVAGMFMVFPSSAVVAPNNSCNVTIDCFADREGKAAEELIIFISDCNPKICPSGIPYKLFAECCLCSINVDNIDSIFEEHYICKNLSQIPTEIEGDGVYGEEERRFDFRYVRIGRKAKARFKISNTSKLPCDVAFTLKQVPHKGAQKTEVFEVEPAKATIPAHGCFFATATFTPPSMQSFSVMFEAAIEGISRSKTLTFELVGEGTLPRMSVIHPTLRNSQDQLLLLFSKILVGRSQTLPMTFFNDGCLPCKVDMIFRNAVDAFTLQTAEDVQESASDNSPEGLRKLNTASVILGVGEKATVKVTFRPQEAERSQTFLKLSVVDNQYEDCLVELVGEGHEEEITIDRVTRIIPAELVSAFQEPPAFRLEESGIESNVLNFGDCFIDSSRSLIFSMTNHSPTDCVRFTWPNHNLLTFSPQVGHLHPGCTKDITVTFLAFLPVVCTEKEVLGRVVKVTFEHPDSEVIDWDDRVKTVKWTDVQDPAQEKPVRPLKRKVVEMEAEPAYTEVEESARDFQLLLTAVADYAQYSCDTTAVSFKDTLMLQTRFYQVTMENTGPVTLSYRWQIDMEVGTVAGESEERKSLSGAVNREDIPFSVEPAWGAIAPGKATVFKVSFSPLDVGHFFASMTCSIPNLEVHSQEPVISLRARGLLPLCHFDLQESDYLSAVRRKPVLPGPKGAPSGSLLDPSTRVVECHAVGVGVTCLREFNIVNPTNNKYNYEWVCEDDECRKLQPAFKCLYPKGHIDSGCRVKVGFRFVSSHLGTVESFWHFSVASHNITIPFLLVGHTREPLAFFDKPHITFDPLLIGSKEMKTVYMINKESIALDFRFVKSSCHNEGFASSVAVDPMSGQIAANSRIPINLKFVPTQEKLVSFNIVCKIQHRVEPLKLNVKAEGYTVSSKLYCEDSTGKRVQLNARGVNQINFGSVQMMEKAIRHLYIYNASKFSLDFQWQLGDCAAVRQGLVRVDKDRGVVQSDDTKQCTLEFCPAQCVPLKDCQLTLKIHEGPTFSVTVLGQGMQPGLQFSFQSYNFGHTFVQCPGEPPPTATLKLTNGDTKNISVYSLYKPTPQLHFNFEPCVLKAGESVSILFTFRPQQAVTYNELVEFKVNGCSQRTVEFLGIGCDVKVEVVNSSQQLVALGTCFVGDIIRREVPIVNHSAAPITFSLAFSPSSSYLTSVGLLAVTPTGPITLPARCGSTKVDILFKPKARIPSFNEQVFLQYGDLTRHLFAISGTCLGVDVELETNYVAFGTVFLRSQISRTLVMTNQGDINTRFRWDQNSFLPDFSIVPVEGYLTSGMEISFDLKFHPQKTSADIRYENLRCFLDGGPHHPLMLTLTGSCTDITPMKEVYTFNTVVRGKETKSIPITNRTLHTWNLTPIIEGSQWSGPTTLTVEHDQTRLYDITYRPLTMTTDSKHNGTIFFPFPDGLGQLFNLVGVAEPPRSSGKVNQEIPCKTDFTQPLSVHNWMSKAQRFQVKIDVIKPEKVDPSLKISYKDNIDVPANSYETYKFNVYAYREGQLFLKVTFTHEPSGEYQFYEVLFRLTRPGAMSVITLPAVVRHNLHHTLTVENPLNTPATLTASCNVPEIVHPANILLPPYSKGQFSFDYLPLKVGEVQGKLELQNPDLGLFIYDLVLRVSPACQEKPVHMRVALGQSYVQPVRFHSYCKQKIEYTCKVDCTDFQVDKSVSVSPSSTGHTEVTVEVTFEPSRLGEQKATLTVCSPVGGDYSFPLRVFGTDPTPQGPILVKTGACSSVFFRNVFFTTVTFSIQVDNPQFFVQKDSETIRPKKDHRILVQLDASRESKRSQAGRLVVSCQSPIDKTSQIQWVYYLKGVTVKREDTMLQTRPSIDSSERR